MPRGNNTYGSRGQAWHPAFIQYMQQMAASPNYAGMPDTYVSEHKIQWEAPSNRGSGQFKDTHDKRLNWWKAKAEELGITVGEDKWISKTAKQLHPTGSKPCKRCGRVMELRYAYPRQILLNRIQRLPYFEPTFVLDPLEHILDLTTRLYRQYGDRVLSDIPAVLSAKGVTVPTAFTSVDELLQWIDRKYIPNEPKTLSPGAMSSKEIVPVN